MALQKREKKMLMIAGPVLALVLVLNFMGVFDPKKAAETPNLANKTINRVTETVTNAVKGEGQSARKGTAGLVQYDKWADRDPFSKPIFSGVNAPKAQSSSPLKLNGVIWMQGKPYVLINDVILTVGEEKKGI